MKWITEPGVWVLAVPRFIDHPQYLLPEGGEPSERLITHGGKGCYDSYGRDGRSIREHISGIISSRHGSVLEHANISIFLTGISRGCSHEIVRHRAGFAYSQRSTRYTREDDASFILDPFYAELEERDIPGTPFVSLNMDEAALLNTFKMQCKSALDTYGRTSDLLMEMAPKEMNGVARRKWARGKARQLLPHALETRMTMTGNLRAWRFFFEERSGAGAEPEIRRLAMHIFNAISEHAPLVFADMMESQTIVDGFPVFKPEVLKV